MALWDMAAEIPVQVRSGGKITDCQLGVLWRGATNGKGRGGSPGLWNLI